MIKPALEFIQLTFQRIRSRINRRLERPGVLLGEQFLARDFNSYFNSLILNTLVIQSKEHLAADEAIVKRVQFVKLLLSELNQFAVCIKVNGMNA